MHACVRVSEGKRRREGGREREVYGEVVCEYIYSVIYLFSSCQRMLHDNRLYFQLNTEINDL